MENIRISDLNYVGYTGYTTDDLFVIVNYDVVTGETKNTTLTDIKTYVLSGFPADMNTYVTGFTYSDNTFTIFDNSGNTFNTTINEVTGLTINGNLIVTGTTSLSGVTTYYNIVNGTNPNEIINLDYLTGFVQTTDVYVTGATYTEATDSSDYTQWELQYHSTPIGSPPYVFSGENTYTTGGTYDNNTAKITFLRNDGQTGYTIDLSAIDVNDTFSTGGTITQSSSISDPNQTIQITGNDGFIPYNITGVTDTYTTGGTYDNNTTLITFDRNDGQQYTIDLSTIDVNDTYVTGGTSTGSTNTSPNATIDLTYNQDVLSNIYSLQYKDTYVTGFTYSDNTFTIFDNSGNTFNTTINEVTGLTINGNLIVDGIISHTGDTNQIGNFNITGNTTQSGNTFQNGNFNITGNTTQLGNIFLTGNTNQLGYLYIVSATTGCTLAVTGDTCLTGPLNITGDTFMSGDFCMNNMNSTGQTGTNCFDTSLIPIGTTVIHQFQSENGVLAHIGDLATGEPNSRGYAYFENNTVLTSFVASGTGVYTPVIGTPQTIQNYNNLFIVITGTTAATTNNLTYNYPPATGTSFTYLKFTVSLSVEVAQNQQLTFQIRRTRGVSVTNMPIGMSITPNGNSANSVSFNGIAEALNQDEFVLVVRNATGSGAGNSVRITDAAFSMFT